jgi:glutathione synthase/RimK-type ligase-like ATP-grasp enzyme
MLAWIIYFREAAEYNRQYIQFYIAEGAKLGIDVRLILVEELKFGIKDGSWFISRQEEDMERPDFVICRAIYPLLSRQLELMGIRVFNNSFTAEICNDKARTYQYLAKTGIKMVDSGFYRNTLVQEAVSKVTEPTVIKAVEGHGGSQVFLITPAEVKGNAPEGDEVESNEAESDEAESDEVESNEAESDEAESDEVESNEAESDEAESDEGESDGAESDGVQNDGVERDEVESDRVESNGTESNGIKSNATQSNEAVSNEVKSNGINSDIGTDTGNYNGNKKIKDMLEGLAGSDVVVQPLTGSRHQDLRVYVIGREIIAAVLRTAKEGFKSNFSLGGEVCLYRLSEEERALVDIIIRQFDFGLVGIDFIIGDDGELIFNEIEDVVGSRMLYRCSDINIVEKYLRFILECLSLNA